MARRRAGGPVKVEAALAELGALAEAAPPGNGVLMSLLAALGIVALRSSGTRSPRALQQVKAALDRAEKEVGKLEPPELREPLLGIIASSRGQGHVQARRDHSAPRARGMPGARREREIQQGRPKGKFIL